MATKKQLPLIDTDTGSATCQKEPSRDSGGAITTLWRSRVAPAVGCGQCVTIVTPPAQWGSRSSGTARRGEGRNQRDDGLV